MTTYSIRGLKTKISQILSDPNAGQEVIITRRREPGNMFTSAHQSTGGKPSLSVLEGSLPDASYQHVLDLQALWAPRARRNTRRRKPAAG